MSEALGARLAHHARAYPGFRSMKWLGVFLLPLDGMLVHPRSLPSNLLGFPQQFAGTHLYSWVEGGTVRIKSLAQEHNTMSPARAQTRTARSGDERTNHEATVPPSQMRYLRPNLTSQNSRVPILSKLDSRLIGTPGSVTFSKTYSLATRQ